MAKKLWKVRYTGQTVEERGNTVETQLLVPPFTQPQLFDASAVLTGGTEPLSHLHHSPGLKEDLLSLVESFTFFKYNLCKLGILHALRYNNIIVANLEQKL